LVLKTLQRTMPIALSLLASCSLFIPPRAWHPAIEDDERPSCPSHVWPAVDGTIGVAGTITATALLADEGMTSGLLHEAFEQATIALLLVPSLIYLASATYGTVQARRCHGELTDLRAVSRFARGER
jgi:hypothetical protein